MAVKKPICNYTGTKEELRAADTLAGPVDSLKSATTSVSVSAATAPATGQVLTATSGSTATWQTPATGDMVLASSQTNTGAKTFLNATLALRNFANTFSGVFYNAITAARTWTFPDKDGTVAMTSDIIGADTSSIVSSENLAAGNLVNIWNNAGTANVRKADATVAGKEAHGFVLSAVTAPAAATVYFEGSNTGVTGLTPGPQFLATTAGLCTATAPAASGNVVQRVGFATSATKVNFQSQTPVGLA